MAGHLVDPVTIHYAGTDDVLADTRVAIRAGDVRRVVLDGPRASAVELSDGERIDASVVVVAAGAFGTPILPHRLGFRAPALGRYLTYHPVLFSQLVLDEELCDGAADDLPPRLRPSCTPPAGRPMVPPRRNR